MTTGNTSIPSGTLGLGVDLKGLNDIVKALGSPNAEVVARGQQGAELAEMGGPLDRPTNEAECRSDGIIVDRRVAARRLPGQQLPWAAKRPGQGDGCVMEGWRMFRHQAIIMRN